MSEHYVYHGMDITLDVYEKIKDVVELLADKENITFEDAFMAFAESRLFELLQNTNTLLWEESPEYLLDEYYRKSAYRFFTVYDKFSENLDFLTCGYII